MENTAQPPRLGCAAALQAAAGGEGGFICRMKAKRKGSSTMVLLEPFGARTATSRTEEEGERDPPASPGSPPQDAPPAATSTPRGRP